ncbi:RWD-domain-containing protein [Trematosphaeria pertusa]|uniref:RBR-type E3 ubiquitin transferase n=1 Tax=Trematosphaeria pertusa TaxID=390896 RepID=A0A6A6IJE3_9PLEO|nr:RWD-domain-containing protein [Trematosphaeria pertusa]KAF2250694.1 RWD-domain-containing protein [Trematosphaeria pertusa]
MADIDLGDERAEELSTLQSIYPELTLHASDPFTAHIDLLVAPISTLPVIFEPDRDVRRLAYLPPLHVEITLPAEYPAAAPPAVKLSTTRSWLPTATLEALSKEARSLWAEYGGGPVLYAYVSYLQEAAETAFGLSELTLASGMKADLLAYSKQMKRELFDKETFDCGVCLEPKKGSACYRMERCNHVFCVACLQDYYANCIQEGDVDNVKCMSTECGTKKANRKKDRLSPKELLQIPLALETVQRYAKIKRKKKIEADPTIIFCPRSWCQGAMRTKKYPKITDVREMGESESEAEDPVAPEERKEATAGPEKRRVGTTGMDRLAVCEDCNLAFCTVCLASWHGDFVRCEPRDSSQLTEDDQASLNFIMRNTSPCPTCEVPCQKSYGCNHMTCFQCKTHFCYLCSAWLNPDQPYQHFNNKRNKGCYQRLMDMAEGDVAQADVRFGGRRGAEQVAEFWEQEAMRIQMELNEEDIRTGR